MFTTKAQSLIDLAKDYAFSSGSTHLGLLPLLTAVGTHAEASVLLAECFELSPGQLRNACPPAPEPLSCPGKLPLSKSVRAMLDSARGLAEEVPDRSHPGLLDVRHLVCAMAACPEVCAHLGVEPIGLDAASRLLISWYERDARTPGVEDLAQRLREMRAALLEKVFGQDHAVETFVEGLFNAEVVGAADTTRRAPRAVFVFAGPPGVGKTYLAELGASLLGRSFRRFDMSAFSGHHQNEALVGTARTYMGAHPGILTEFVEKNPNAVLLFDEIEKAHPNTIQLFLQVLDAGILEDKFLERNVSFRDTTIIFTTNAARKLYERPNESGVHAANASFHRKTILDALAGELDPRTAQPVFPPGLHSRLSSGYPVLFNHLRVNELERVARAELERVGDLLERQYYKRLVFDEFLPLCLVLREGARTDARALRAQAEAFVKTELFKFCGLFEVDRLEEVFERADTVRFSLDDRPADLAPEVRSLLQPSERPRVLLVANPQLAALYQRRITEIDWLVASTSDEALELLANQDVDLALLDLWFGRGSDTLLRTLEHFDHPPPAARGLDRGQEVLRRIRERLPNIPVYLLSYPLAPATDRGPGPIDEELFMACVRGGGARGMLSADFLTDSVEGWEHRREELANQLVAICRSLRRERAAERMGQEHKALLFETAPIVDPDKREITIRLRNLRLTRAIAAADAGEILDEVERPTTRFEDVIGAETAKEELRFFIDYLKNPRRFAALGLKPPKGVLLYGPPGTGKTMLARAMAGECNVAFIAANATGFVTIWQGSGPQNVRDLFARARRYAPAIIFIDEIDAIGKVRVGSAGAGRAEENTLNALFTEMDGFTSPSPDRPVFLLAATNFTVQPPDEAPPERSPRTLDPALVRRFSRCILVDLPDAPARREYFVRRLTAGGRCSLSDAALDLLAEKSAGMTIASLEQVVETATRSALKKATHLTDDLILDALDAAREGEAKEWSPEFLERTARHEAGHTLVYWLSGWWSPEVSIIARASRGGGMRRAEAESKRETITREEALARIRVALAGRAAEMVYYGQDGLTTGASADLENATNIARQMVCCYGMDEEFGLLATPELFKHPQALSSPIYQRVNEAAARILKEQMARTIELLQQNRQHLDALSRALLEKNRLLRADLKLLLPPIAQKAERT